MSNKKENTRKRSSIITIFLVVALLFAVAVFLICILNNIKNDEKKDKEQYISNLYEEDLMQYEYEKIDNKLKGMYAFGIYDNYLVGVISKDNFVNIVEIDPNKQYDYKYKDTNLYLLDKETGNISVIDLKNLGNVINTIELSDTVKSFSLYNDSIYYISNNKLIKFENMEKSEILTDVTSDDFVIKNDNIYIVRSNQLLKLDMQGNETVIDDNVLSINYYDYYEKDKLVYTTSSDSENFFKKIYNFYTGEITNSIKNNTYFVPYGANQYIYTNSDNSSILVIKNSDINKYLYKFDEEINNINLFKEGYLVVSTENKNILIDIDTEKEINTDNIINLYDIKYIKL